MHYMGLCGLPRRVCCYDPCFYYLNMITALGAILSGIRGVFMFFIIWESLASGNKVVSAWGSSATVVKVAVVPTPYHSLYFSGCRY